MADQAVVLVAEPGRRGGEVCDVLATRQLHDRSSLGPSELLGPAPIPSVEAGGTGCRLVPLPPCDAPPLALRPDNLAVRRPHVQQVSPPSSPPPSSPPTPGPPHPH